MKLSEIRELAERTKDLPEDTPVFVTWCKSDGVEDDVSIDTLDSEEFDKDIKWHLKGTSFEKIIMIYYG